MDPHISQGSVAILEETAPHTIGDHRIEGAHRGRTGPKIIVEPLGRVARILEDVSHPVVGVDTDLNHLAEPAGIDDLLFHIDQMVGSAPLETDLADAARFVGSAHQRLALRDIDPDRLLNEQVDPSPHRLDSRKRVLMVGGIDKHQVELLGIEHFTPILVEFRNLLRDLTRRGQFPGRFQVLPVDVAKSDDIYRRDLKHLEQVAFAVPAGTDQPDLEGFVGHLFGKSAVAGRHRGQGAHHAQAANLEKIASSHLACRVPFLAVNRTFLYRGHS